MCILVYQEIEKKLRIARVNQVIHQLNITGMANTMPAIKSVLDMMLFPPPTNLGEKKNIK